MSQKGTSTIETTLPKNFISNAETEIQQET